MGNNPRNSIVDKETAKYIVDYFSHLLSDEEKLAVRHTVSKIKLCSPASNTAALTRIYKERGWLTENQSFLDLLKDGYDNFQMLVAKRILSEHSDQVFLNNCPNCDKLARTPQARQCRYCGFNWHEMRVAKFRLNSSFQLTGREFFLIGEITGGEARIGNYIDLTMYGLNCKAKITAIEFALKRVNGIATEDIALGTNELNEPQKQHLISLGAFSAPVDIVKEK